jgi:5-methylcytosine-specific restriction enzyme subunit McrC
MKNTLIITEHEEIKVATIRDIGKKIISKEDKELLFSIIHKDTNGEERYVFSRKGKYGIKSNSLVGSISIKNGLIIEVLPKFAKGDLTEENIKRYRETLIDMIRVSKEKNFLSSTTQSSKISKGEMPLIRYMIELFSQSLLAQLRNGIFANYNRKVDNLSYIKGNILVSKTIQNNLIDKTKIYVSHNKHSSNNLLMQIFKTLAKILLNDTNLSYKAKNNLYEVYTLLDGVAIINLKKYHFHDMVFSRLNDKYEILFRQAEYIFNQYMPFTSNHSSTPFWAILFNMDYLFEKFCAYLFKKSNISFKAQNRIKVFTNKRKTLAIKPDFIIENCVVVDAKWKLINKKTLYGLNAQNFWQLFSYMNLVSEEEMHGYFIVPKNSSELDDEILFERQGNKSITILSIDFSLKFEEILEKYKFKIVDNKLVLDSGFNKLEILFLIKEELEKLKKVKKVYSMNKQDFFENYEILGMFFNITEMSFRYDINKLFGLTSLSHSKFDKMFNELKNDDDERIDMNIFRRYRNNNQKYKRYKK